MERRLSLGFAVVALAVGCTVTTVTYPGPRRPANEVAVLVNAETSLDMLDGQYFHHIHRQDGARYDVLPGRHMLGVTLFIVTVIPGGGADIERSLNTVVFCFDARQGHTYFVTHEGRGERWRPVITDEGDHVDVPFAPCS